MFLQDRSSGHISFFLDIRPNNIRSSIRKKRVIKCIAIEIVPLQKRSLHDIQDNDSLMKKATAWCEMDAPQT